jgi:hypothetical protein
MVCTLNIAYAWDQRIPDQKIRNLCTGRDLVSPLSIIDGAVIKKIQSLIFCR